MSTVTFDVDESEALSKPARTKKKVTIQTPPHSPEDVPVRYNVDWISDPNTRSTFNDENGVYASTSAADQFLQLSHQAAFQSTQSNVPPSRAPFNPFARTLATTEAAYGSQRPTFNQETNKGNNEAATKRRSGVNSGFDVDTFKTMLLSGEGPPPVSNLTTTPQYSDNREALPQVSTDPGFEEFDDLESASEDSESIRPEPVSDDENKADLNQAISHQDRDSYGLSKGPQTVSFAEFDQSVTDIPYTSSKSPRAAGTLSTPQPTEARTTTTSATGTRAEAGVLGRQNSDDPTAQKKAPPPPPTSRRQVQAVSSQPVTNKTATDAAAPSNQPKSIPAPLEAREQITAAPQPPPSRRPRPTSFSNSPGSTTPVPSPAPLQPQTDVNKNVPPPPRRRTQAQPVSYMDRTSSTASYASLTRVEIPSTPTGSKPPTPPPRRGGGGSRTSLDGAGPSAMAWVTANSRRRSSASSTRSNVPTIPRRGFEAGIQRAETAPSEDADSSNVLEDLSAFQAEIDALRAQAEGRG